MMRGGNKICIEDKKKFHLKCFWYLTNGHNVLINKVIEVSEKHNCSPAIMTFNPMPQEFFRQHSFFKIMSDEDKLAHLENMGIKKCYLIPFTQAFSEIDADTFINQILLKSLRVEHLIAVSYTHLTLPTILRV